MEPSAARFADRAELDGWCGDRLAGLRLAGLYVTGSLAGLAAPTVAVVGSRAPSDTGARLARRMAADLARNGVCVISGLALGIDGAAHRGALDAGAPTIGILGGGHDCFFPARHRGLAAAIVASGGAVASPYAPAEPARPHQFLARNAIVAALADAVVVVEAAVRSGALNTASWAADRSVRVLAVPGDVDRPGVAGCLALLRDGATLVRDADDVLAELGLASAVTSSASAGVLGVALPPDPLGRALVTRLGRAPAALDALLDGDEPPQAVIARVSELLADGTLVSSSDTLLRLARQPG